MHPKTMVVNLIALFFLASVTAFGADKAEVKGMITSRTGETLAVKSSEGNVTVVNVKEVRKNPAKDPRLKPGDTVEIPQSFW